MTAIRVEVPPINAELARHTPESGFIVDLVQGWVISPGGQKSKIAFRYFAQDAQTNLQAAVLPETDPAKKGNEPDPIPSAFAALPKLYRTRWIVGVLGQPLLLPAGSRIQIDLRAGENYRCQARPDSAGQGSRQAATLRGRLSVRIKRGRRAWLASNNSNNNWTVFLRLRCPSW